MLRAGLTRLPRGPMMSPYLDIVEENWVNAA